MTMMSQQFRFEYVIYVKKQNKNHKMITDERKC